MKLFPFLKIRNQVLLFGMIMSTIPLIFMTSYYLVQIQADMEERIGERQTLLLNDFANQFNLEMERTFQLVQMLSQLSNLQEERSLLYSILKENSLIEEIVILDAEGFITDKVSRYQLNIVEEKESWLESSMIATYKTNAFLSDVQFNIYGQPIMKLALPIVDEKSNSSQGTVGLTLQLQKLIGEISSYNLNEPGHVFLLDSVDRIIAHQDYTQLWQQRDFLATEGEASIRKTTNLDGVEWQLVLEQPTQELLEPMYKLVRNSIIVAIFIIALISVISIYAGLYFIKPIEILQKAMKNVKHGSQQEINVFRNDEFGELAKSFNEMSQEISEKTDQLLQEKERLDIIVSSLGAGLAVVRSDYKVTWMNETLKSWVDTNVALPCYKLFNNSDEPCCDCPGILDNCEKDISEYLVKKDENGKNRVFRHRVYPLKHSANQIQESLILIEDITEQKEMEEALIQTDKLSALGLMASSFAHEVNNPLATIKVYAEDLLDRFEEDDLEQDELLQYLTVINENTDRCKKITRNLLNFSRKSEWSIQDVEVNEVVQSSLELVRHSLKKSHIQLQTSLDPTLPTIKGDSLNLMQVLVNIMNNGIDAIEEEEGSLKIETKFLEKSQEVVIAITDTGVGIPKDNLSKVFDPFYTTKPVGKGTGLGLSVCYGLVNQFGGTIGIDSEIGMGTTFEIKIPVNASLGME